MGWFSDFFGGSKSQETTQSTEPWKVQQPFLTQGFGAAQNWLQDPKSHVAGFTPAQTQAHETGMNLAQNFLPQLTNKSMGALNTAFNATDVFNNPALKAAISGAIDPVTQALTEQWLPQVRSGSIGSGMYGGSRQGLAEGLALDRATRTAQNTTAQMMNQAYGQGLNTMMQGLQLAPSVASTGMLPMQIMSGIGAEQQALNQAQINDPMQRLAQYWSIVGQPLGQTSTTTSTMKDPGAVFKGLAGLGMMGAGFMTGNPLLGMAGAGSLGGGGGSSGFLPGSTGMMIPTEEIPGYIPGYSGGGY